MPMAARGAIPVVLPSADSTKFAMQYFFFMLPTPMYGSSKDSLAICRLKSGLDLGGLKPQSPKWVFLGSAVGAVLRLQTYGSAHSSSFTIL